MIAKWATRDGLVTKEELDQVLEAVRQENQKQEYEELREKVRHLLLQERFAQQMIRPPIITDLSP